MIVSIRWILLKICEISKLQSVPCPLFFLLLFLPIFLALQMPLVATSKPLFAFPRSSPPSSPSLSLDHPACPASLAPRPRPGSKASDTPGDTQNHKQFLNAVREKVESQNLKGRDSSPDSVHVQRGRSPDQRQPVEVSDIWYVCERV